MTCGYCGKDEASGFLWKDGKPIGWECWRRLVLDPYEAKRDKEKP